MTRILTLMAGLLGLLAFNDGGGAAPPAPAPAPTPPAGHAPTPSPSPDPAPAPPAGTATVPPAPPPTTPSGDSSEVAALKAEIAELRKANETDQEKAVREAREAGAATAQQQLHQERTANAVFRAAAGRMDPDVAVALVKIPADKVGADGHPDPAAVTAAIDQLLTEKPSLATVSPGTGPTPRDPASGKPTPTPQQGAQPAATDDPGTGTARLRQYYAAQTGS